MTMGVVVNRGARRRRALSDINVVPYIDVMLVLLVIFMVAAPLVNSSVVEVPRVAQSTQAPQAPIEITIKQSGELLVADKAHVGEAARVVLRAHLLEVVQSMMTAGERAVLIAADRDVKYEHVMHVLSDLQQAKLRTVSLLVRQNDPR